MNEVKNARIVVHIGATGSGKSAAMELELKSEPLPERFFAWDIKGEWSKKLGIPILTDWEMAARCLEAMKRGARLRVAFMPPLLDEAARGRMFTRLCAHFVGDPGKGVPPIANAGLLVEEASLVLKPGGGNEKLWLTLVNIQAREHGIALFVVAQRPTFIDKSSLANVTKLRVFKLGYGPDMDTLADVLRVPGEAVAAIRKLEYIERDTEAGEVRPGRLPFAPPPSSSAPAAAEASAPAARAPRAPRARRKARRT